MAHEGFWESIWKHGLRSKYIKQFTQSAAFSNWSKGVTGSGLTNAQIEQNDWNAEEAQKQRDFTLQMDNTKYQRQSADMAAAGLNPAMMYGQGYSASTSSGSAASGGDVGVPSAGLLDSVMNVIFAKQRMKNLKAEEENIQADTGLKEKEGEGIDANIGKTKEETEMIKLQRQWFPKLSKGTLDKIDADIDKIYQDIEVDKAQIFDLEADAALKSAQAFVQKTMADWADRLNAAKEKADKAAAAASFARAAYDNYARKFAEEHGGQLPGYNMWSGLASSLADALKDIGWSDVELDDLGWEDLAWPALSFIYRSFIKKNKKSE